MESTKEASDKKWMKIIKSFIKLTIYRIYAFEIYLWKFDVTLTFFFNLWNAICRKHKQNCFFVRVN